MSDFPLDPMPHDPVAERALLAALILDPTQIPKIRETLPVHAFYSRRNGSIYAAILSCYDEFGTVDHILLQSRLRAREGFNDAKEVGTYIWGLLDEVPRNVNARHYAHEVSGCCQRREAVNAATVMQSLVHEPGGVEEAVRYVRTWAELVERNAIDRPLRVLNLAEILAGPEPEIPWVIEGWLAEEEVAQFAGEWATGKSYVALDLAISLAAGIPWLGIIPVKQCAVLYVDEENTGHTARRRIRRMLKGRMADDCAASLPVTYLHRNSLNLSSARGVAWLRREIERSQANVVILDSLVDLIGFDMLDNKLSSAFYRELKRVAAETRCAIVVLDHMRKPGKDDNGQDPAHRIVGASMKSNIVDETWTLCGDRDKDTRQLSASKARGGDRLPSTLTTRYEESEDGVSCWISASPTEQLSRAVVVGIVAQAGQAGIYSKELTAAIMARVGVSKSTALRVVTAATNDGDLIRQSVGSRVLYQARNGN